MSCTTILVGKNASWDSSTMMARNEDCGAGKFMPKKFVVVRPEDQPRHYRSVLTKLEIRLPDDPMRYTAVPNAIDDEGVWGEAGVNERNVAMSATETITSNARVQGADPLVKDGIGEEDMLTITLPYIRSAREGVRCLGALLETFGTCEMNGIGFQDADEVWWMETIGGHHWIARRVPDDCYAVIPNQQGIDFLDMTDALGAQKAHMCSADLADFIRVNHLDTAVGAPDPTENRRFDVRGAFGSRADSDHTYNTPRAWAIERWLSPDAHVWDDPAAGFGPESDRLPWCLTPGRRITVEDVKYALSSHFQGTPYDPYGRYGDDSQRGRYRPVGVNRTNHLVLTQLRPGLPKEITALQWVAMASNVFNAFVPFYTWVGSTPAYLSDTGRTADMNSLYWASRVLGALADAHFQPCAIHIERYQNAVARAAHRLIGETDAAFLSEAPEDAEAFLEGRNRDIADMAKRETDAVLDKVLFESSLNMKNAYARADA